MRTHKIQSTNQENKLLVYEFWNRLDALPNDVSVDQAHAAALPFLDTDMHWRGCEPLGALSGPRAFAEQFWTPFKKSFSDIQRSFHILIGGPSLGRVDGSGDGRMWVGGTGHMTANFVKDYVGIPATGAPVKLRWGEFCRVENGRIVEINLMFDLIDLALQTGHRLLPVSRGKEGLYPPPEENDGVHLHECDAHVSDESLDHIRRFIFDGLESYDHENLKSMRMAEWFHPQLKWYGPTGIGACLSFEEFETLHQRPWLEAFPDRSSGNLTALIGEGAYTGFTDFDGMKATHTGPYLDQCATQRALEISGLDFWKREGDVLVENWVFVDMIGLFRQMGVDLLARIRT